MREDSTTTIAVAEWESETLGLAGAEQYRAWMRRVGIMDRLVLETHTGQIVASSYQAPGKVTGIHERGPHQVLQAGRQEQYNKRRAVRGLIKPTPNVRDSAHIPSSPHPGASRVQI